MYTEHNQSGAPEGMMHICRINAASHGPVGAWEAAFNWKFYLNFKRSAPQLTRNRPPSRTKS